MNRSITGAWRLGSRRLLQFGALTLFGAGALQAYSGGPPPRFSGAPGDNSGACTSCHSGAAPNAGKGSVKIVLPGAASYLPGVTQHIVVQVADPQQHRWGFELSARLKSDLSHGQAGDLKPTDSFTQVICDSGNPKPCAPDSAVQFIQHTTAGTRLGTAGGVSFEFDWTPPPQRDAGNVVLYVAANAANGDGGTNGDHIYTTSVELTSNSPDVPPAVAVSKYAVHNLVSDVAGLADQTDPNLTNAWGIALNASGPFWIGANHSGTNIVYDGAGQPSPAGNGRTVRIPGGAPTGQAFNGTPGFEVASGNAAVFIFASEAGIISAWNPAVDPDNAKVMVDNSGSGAVYKGLAIGASSGGPMLYAANFNASTIDVFDGSFHPATVSGGFSDPNLPSGYAPFNIQKIGRRLYVTYAVQDGQKHDDVAGVGNGLINVFDMNGNLLLRLVTNGPLNSPWGLAMAPSFFGDYSNALLVGNFADGLINAFDPFSGSLLGTLQDAAGNPISISGLWGLQFGNGHTGGDANTLYFTAGIANGGNVKDHGLFGAVQVAQ